MRLLPRRFVMAVARRVGAETSKSRDVLLDCVERLMLEKGYAGVSYRAVAACAAASAGLVQYYFPKMDELFIAAIRRRSDQNLSRLQKALADRPNEPLRVVWEYSRDEATAALTSEFMALGNHRPSIRAVIAEVTEQIRHVQLEALAGCEGIRLGDTELSAGALLFLITGVPKLVRLEQGVGVNAQHKQVVGALERFLDSLQPSQSTKRPHRQRPARRPSRD
jgi:AcrR family transcriptional regulator